jgi:hypothetical protein
VAEKFRPGAVPVPLRVTDCGLPAALSVIVTLAARLPLAAGAKVTLMVQFEPPARELPHVFVWTKSPLLVPVIAMLVIVIATVPVLLNVIVCAALVVPTFWLPKLRLVAENPKVEAMPVPVRFTICGLLLALSKMLRKALSAPSWLG